jgi:diacylglycerol kinase (ATP)
MAETLARINPAKAGSSGHMAVVAVVAHARKSIGGGLPELRRALALHGCTNPIWHEVRKSRKAGRRVRSAIADGADVIFVWGGDGMVQHCLDAIARSPKPRAALAIIPAGTANLLASNLGIRPDIDLAVRTGLYGQRRPLDTGSVNGEHFAVMAGAGFDAEMIERADRTMKARVGRSAYLLAGAASLSIRPARAKIKVDGERFYRGRVSCLLVGNVSKIMGGVHVFRAAEPDDGILDLGIVTARNPAQWASLFGRLAAGKASGSKFVRLTRGTKFTATFDRPVRYELDGGARKFVTKLRIKVHPAAITVCVPSAPN